MSYIFVTNFRFHPQMSDTGFRENLSAIESKFYCEKVFAFDTENVQQVNVAVYICNTLRISSSSL